MPTPSACACFRNVSHLHSTLGRYVISVCVSSILSAPSMRTNLRRRIYTYISYISVCVCVHIMYIIYIYIHPIM